MAWNRCILPRAVGKNVSQSPGTGFRMNTEQEAYNAIRAMLIGEFEIPADAIHRDARLYEDLGIDSIDAVDMVVMMREKTGAYIAPERFKAVRTIGDVVGIYVSISR